jgi:hypothetical protein
MSFLFGRKKTIRNSENKIGSLRVQSSSQGLPIAIVFGQTRVPGNLLDYFDFTAIPHTEKQKSGGKGGGGTTVENTTYTYTVGVLIGLMEGPAALSNFVGTIWSNKDVTDATKLGFSEYSGSYSQSPFPYLTTAHPAQALHYRGQAYVAHAALDLGSSDGLPNLSFEVTGLLGAGDQNPADIVDLLLTSDKFGAGWPVAQLGDLSDFYSYCDQAGFLASPAYTAQRSMGEMLSELAELGNSAVVWSGGVLQIKTYADEAVGSYTPDLTVRYSLTDDDFIAPAGEPPVRIRRKRQSDAFNQVQVECLDRTNQYNPAVVDAKDQAAIDIYGLRPMDPIEAHAICDLSIARLVAQTKLQRQLYVRNVYSFTVGWRYVLLEPMDIVALTDTMLALDELPVRIISIEENENGDLAIEAEELTIGISTPGAYTPQGSSGSTPAAGVDPGDTNPPVIFQPPLALTGGKPQIWIGAAGGVNWGGAEIHVSADANVTYTNVGVITNPATYGVLTANFPSGSDPDTVNTLAVDLSTSNGSITAAPQSSADALATLSYVDSEIVAYSAANLTSPNNYSFSTYIRRGQVGSNIGAHLAGTTFMRLNEAVQKFDISPGLFGTTLQIKLPAYNTQGGGQQDLAAATPYPFTVVAQAFTGAGFAFRADRTSTTVADPGNGIVRWNNASLTAANQIVFDALTADGANMVGFFASVSNTGYMELRDYADPTKWAAYTITASNAQSGFQVFSVAYKASGSNIPHNDTVLVTFTPTQTGVTSVGLTLPATLFAVANSPVTTTGNLTATLVTQNAATVFAGPVSGNATAPAFRALVASDLGAQNASQFLAGPVSGNAANAAFRAIVGGDVPKLTINTQTANYTLALADGNVAYVRMNSANATVVTVPSNANAAFANGSSILIARAGNGSVTIAQQANVTVNNSSSNTLRVQNSVGALVKTGTDTWDLFGDTT